MTEKAQKTHEQHPGGEPERLDLRSHDIAADKREALLRLFPEARTEGGKIDFERLRLALGDVVDIGKERYGLTWPGKADCFKAIQTPSLGTLRPCPEESVEFDTTENLIIEGDNLEVLKLLQKSYLGKVKMIYIDPPYNTGNDFIYPDDFSESLQTYLQYTGQRDSEGRRFGTNSDTDGRFHSRWLNMLYPRLYLARNLLSDGGFIAVTIDDNEAENLRRLLDEIFGEENFVACAVWQKAYTANMTARFISDTHDYVMIYARNATVAKFGRIARTEEQRAAFKNPDNDPRGPWKAENLSAGKFYSAGRFEIVGPTGRKFLPPAGRYWRCNEEQYEEWLSDNRITFGRDGNGRPMLKKFLSEMSEGLTPSTWWNHENFGSNKEASLQLKALLDGESFPLTPKPVKLLSRLCELMADESAIVMDFFAGSGATAEAVIRQNISDRGNRQFILVQLPELTGLQDYSTIAEITKKRVRRVIQQVHKEKEGQLDLDGPKSDFGFRVYKLAESNFATWENRRAKDTEALAEQLEFHVGHIRKERSDQDLLYEILLKSGFPLTTPVEALTLEGKTVYCVAGGDLLVCLDRALTLDVIRAMAARQPARVVCLDVGFAGNDQLKANAVQTFKKKDVASFKTI